MTAFALFALFVPEFAVLALVVPVFPDIVYAWLLKLFVGVDKVGHSSFLVGSA